MRALAAQVDAGLARTGAGTPREISGTAFWALLIAPALVAPLPPLLAGLWPQSAVPVTFVIWAALDLPHWFSTWTSALLDGQMRRRHRRYLVASTALIVVGSGWLLLGGAFDALFNIRLWLALAHCVQMYDHIAGQLDDPQQLPPWIWKLLVIAPPLYLVGVPVSGGVHLFGQPVYGTALFAWLVPAAKVTSIAILLFTLTHLGASLLRGQIPQRLLFVASTWSVFLCYDLFGDRNMVLMGTIAAHSVQYALLTYVRNRGRAEPLRRAGSRLLAHMARHRLSYLGVLAFHSAAILFLQYHVAPNMELSAWFFIFPLSMAHIFYDALLFADRSFRLLGGLARGPAGYRDGLDLDEQLRTA